ncbi:hypothetical protein ACVWZ4_001322 [Bradyrhizobium sp. USDA 4472]
MSSIDIALQAVLKLNLLKKALGQWRLLACILAPGIVLLSAMPAGLTLERWRLFAVYVVAFVGSILRPYNETVVICDAQRAL